MIQVNKIVFYSFLVCLIGLNNIAYSQIEVNPNIIETLAIKLPELSNRTVSQKNIVEYLLATNNFKKPIVGQNLYSDDTSNSVWEKITKNDKGWYESKLLRGGYAHMQILADKKMNLLLEGSAYSMVYVNDEPRAGNVYQYKDEWQSWEPDFGFSYLPIKLKEGVNELLFKCYYGRFKVRFIENTNELQFNTKDLTVPDLRVNEKVNHFGGIIIINNSEKVQSNLLIKAYGKNLEDVYTKVPVIQPLSTRKVKFDFIGPASKEKNNIMINVDLINKVQSNIIHSEKISIRVLDSSETYKQTFISNIDGSVQYYAVNPTTGSNDQKALFFSLHGAAVNADNQANSYAPKNWGIIVSPTNRRPYGFNWEDWGRLDALEVFDIALDKFNIDPSRIYLTGHSMGGHGTWHIGGTFPDKFAAIGPSAGWISFWSYRFNDKYLENNPVINLINRTGSPSDTYSLVKNYNDMGVYIIHGADDNNVKATQSHSIIKELEKSHRDYVYHEEKDAGHWWDKSDEQGADCVDWAPMFDFFARHSRPEKHRKLNVKFITASPGVSAKNNWVTIYRQKDFFDYSSVDLKFDPGIQRISGSTKNITVLAIDADILNRNKALNLILDGQFIDPIDLKKMNNQIWLEKNDTGWLLTSEPNPAGKSPQRYGTFKDAFRNNVVFIYGTKGTEEENTISFAKARYDAEHFWYQGNGSIEVIADKEFNIDKYKNRNIIIYGNSETNSSWNLLLNDSPIQVDRHNVVLGNKTFSGSDLSCLFIRPRKKDSKSTIGVVSGTGIIGHKLNNSRPYMSPGFTFPDVVIFSSDILKGENKGYVASGFYSADWTIENGEFEFSSKYK